MNVKAFFAFLIAILAAVSALTASAANLSSYPTRALRFVVPFPAGGANDIFARVVGTKLSEFLGQQVVVDNRPGGGGSIGAEIAALARPDGYTLLLANTGPNAIDVTLRPRASYDATRVFAPVTQISSVPLVLVVPGGLDAKTLAQFVASAKAHPGHLNYASAGNGSIAHLATELFKAHAGVVLTHVPYKGTPPALTDLVAGQVSMLFTTTVSSGPFIKSGRVRALAIAAPERSPLLPDVPTMTQAGQSGFEISAWYGIVVPVNTSHLVISRLYSETARALRDPEVIDRFEALGGTAVGSDPKSFGIFLKQEVERWAQAVKLSGARID